MSSTAALSASPLPWRALGATRRIRLMRGSSLNDSTMEAVSSSEPSSMTITHQLSCGSACRRSMLAPITRPSLRQGIRNTTKSSSDAVPAVRARRPLGAGGRVVRFRRDSDNMTTE